LNQFLKGLHSFSKFGTLRGKHGARTLTNMNAYINNMTQELKDRALTRNGEALANAFTAKFRNSIGKKFDAGGLGQIYGEMQEHYTKYSNTVEFAENLVRVRGRFREGKVPEGELTKRAESFFNRLMSNSEKNLTEKGMRKRLIELVGGNAAELFDDIALTEAAKRLSPIIPNHTLNQIKASGTALASTMAMGSVNPIAGAAVGAAMLPSFSPRGVLKMSGVVGPALNSAQGN